MIETRKELKENKKSIYIYYKYAKRFSLAKLFTMKSNKTIQKELEKNEKKELD